VRVDGHVHVAQESWTGEGWWQRLSRVGAAVLPGVTAELVREHVVPTYFDPDGSNQLGSMETAGLDMAVMYPYDWTTNPLFGTAPVGWREQNAWYRDFAAGNPNRIRWGFGADPRQPGALEAFRAAVGDEGARCLKIHPANGFALNDPAVYPFMEAAGELGVPVVFHVGPNPTYSRWSEPMLLDQVAADFPDVPIQAAHTGNGLWRDVLAVAAFKPNVHCDLSGWQIRFQRNPERFYADVREVLEGVGPQRVMWGTDGPYYRAVVTDDVYLKAFTEAPEGTFAADEVEAICGGTAAAFFGLPS
jgi:predicted TIM-barrel fold metal-dependent hydrolase